MATPVGHTLIGIALARRLGVRTPVGMAAAAVGASLPDVDVIAGIVLHRDPWRLHRKFTHTPGFAVGVGMVAGFAGIVSAGSAEGERDLIADAFTGAAIVASHILLDTVRIPPYIRTKRRHTLRRRMRNEAFNVVMDLIVYGFLARMLWPRESDAASA